MIVSVGVGVRLGDGLDEGVIDGSGVGFDATETDMVSVGLDVVAEACELGSWFPQATLAKARARMVKNFLYNLIYHHLYLHLVLPEL